MRFNLAPEPASAVAFSSQSAGDHHRLRLEASTDLAGRSTGWFATPSSPVELVPASPHARPRRYLGYSFAQFAMPVVGAPDRPFDWNPAANVFSPPVVLPLVVDWDDDTVSLLAPLDAWHEQVLAVDQDERGIHRFRWGFHGDLDELPAGTRATLAIVDAPTVAAAFDRWRDALIEFRGQPLPRRAVDPITTHLSYWTDNGAAYWYRREPDRDLAGSVVDKVTELGNLGVQVRSVELDSWFYPHEISRPIAALAPLDRTTDRADSRHRPATGTEADSDAELDEVPPTGMLAWEPRHDVLPRGVGDLHQRLDGRPLVLHSRHISDRSSYLAVGEWWTDYGAHPTDPAFFERWFDDAAAWGATCIEQDWMLMIWFGIGQLRQLPGRALAWQRSLDRLAAERHMSLLWCMATPGDLLATVELERICAVRTCDDYRYAHDPSRLWRWYLAVNRLARTLELPVSKDCFFTATEPGPSGHDGDPHAEAESLLAALSGGVVGIGDRIGRTDPEIVGRVCRPDGLLVGPDHPIALTDSSFFDHGSDQRITWAETISRQPAGHWRYLVALHLADQPEPVAGRYQLDRPCLVYDWRHETAEVTDVVDLQLDHRDWRLLVCCPLLDASGSDDPMAVIGDPLRYATAASDRLTIKADGTVAADLADGETNLAIRYWNQAQGLFDRPPPGQS